MRHETVFNLQLNSAKFVELHPCLNQGFLFSLFLLLLCLVFRMTFPVSVLFWLLVSVIFFISRSQWTQSCRYVSVNFCTKIYITFVLQIGWFSPGFGFSFILINCNDLCENVWAQPPTRCAQAASSLLMKVSKAGRLLLLVPYENKSFLLKLTKQDATWQNRLYFQ